MRNLITVPGSISHIKDTIAEYLKLDTVELIKSFMHDPNNIVLKTVLIQRSIEIGFEIEQYNADVVKITDGFVEIYIDTRRGCCVEKKDV